MAKKKGRPKKTKLQKDFEAIAKTDLMERFSAKVIKAALEAGFVRAQIEKFTGEESLKSAAIRHKPGLAKMFIEKPPAPEKKEIEYTEEEVRFDVSILAGFGPLSDHVRRESQQIEREIKRKGIPVFDMLNINIDRSMTAAEDGRKHSKVIVKYRKGT